MKVILHIILGICLRVLLYFSQYKKIFADLLLFPMSAYSFSSLKENFVYSLLKSPTPFPAFQSNNTFIVSPRIIYITLVCPCCFDIQLHKAHR